MEVRFLAFGYVSNPVHPYVNVGLERISGVFVWDEMKKWKPVQFLELLSRKEMTPEQEGEGAWLVSGALSRMEVALGWA